MVKSIETDNKRTLDTMAYIKPFTDKDGGVNLAAAIKIGKVEPDDLRFIGFKPMDVDKALSTVKASKETGVAIPGDITWNYKGKVITDSEYRQVVKEYETKRDNLIKQGKLGTEEWFNLGGHPSSYTTLTNESAKRVGIEVTAGQFAAARALQPEVTAKDITAADWTLTGVNAILLGCCMLARVCGHIL